MELCRSRVSVWYSDFVLSMVVFLSQTCLLCKPYWYGMTSICMTETLTNSSFAQYCYISYCRCRVLMFWAVEQSLTCVQLPGPLERELTYLVTTVFREPIYSTYLVNLFYYLCHYSLLIAFKFC